jgi:hypothetical protein
MAPTRRAHPIYLFAKDPQDTERQLSPTTGNKERKCMVCWENLDDKTAPMPCGHFWCASCIVQAFTSIRNESQWPVKCSSSFSSRCGISFDTAKPFLQDEEIQRLTPLIEEFNTPSLSRTYCSNIRCGIFVPRIEAKDRIAHCRACRTNTCSDCNGPAHGTDLCPLPDQNEQDVLSLSHNNKWQRCTRCGQMCEKAGGCSQMTCLCGYNFCYYCAKHSLSCVCGSEHDQFWGLEPREHTPVSNDRATVYRQDNFQREFANFTSRRARVRTGLEPEALYEQRERYEAIRFEEMARRVRVNRTARLTRIERDLAERKHRQEPCSIRHRLGREIKQLCDRIFGL